MQVINRAELKMFEAGAEAGERCNGELCASRAAVQVQAKVRMPSRNGERGWRKRQADVGIAREHGREPVFHHNRDFEIGPRLFEQSERRSGEHTIAQGAEADHRDTRALGQTLDDGIHPELVFDARFVDEHDGDVVADRVDALALDALQPGAARLQFQRSLAQRADQDFQKLLADGHRYIKCSVVRG